MRTAQRGVRATEGVLGAGKWTAHFLHVEATDRCISHPPPLRGCMTGRLSDTGLKVFATCPPSYAASPQIYLREVLEVARWSRSEEHTSELQSQSNLVCRLLLEKKKEH